MNKIFKLFPVALAVFAMASCSSDDFTASEAEKAVDSKFKLTATVEDLDPVTRASFAETSSKVRSLVWQNGDVIRMLDKGLAGYNLYQYTGTEVSQAVDFSLKGNKAQIDAQYGLYPEENVIATMYSKTNNTQAQAYFTIPEVVAYGETKTTDADVKPAYLCNLPLWGPTKEESTEENPVVGFYYLTAMIRIDMDNLTDAQKFVTVKAPSGEILSGNFYADLSTTAPEDVILKHDPANAFCGAGRNYIIADLNNMQDRAGVVYIPVPVGTYKSLEIWTATTLADARTLLGSAIRFKTVGGVNSDVASLKNMNVKMNRKNVGNFTMSNETVEFDDITTFAQLNAKLATFSSDVEITIKANNLATTASDYTIEIPEGLADNNVTLIFGGAADGSDGSIDASATNLQILGKAQSLTIIDPLTTANVKNIDILTNGGTTVNLKGLNYGTISTADAQTYGDGTLNIGNGVDAAASTTVTGLITLNKGALNVLKSGSIQAVSSKGGDISIQNGTVAGAVTITAGAGNISLTGNNATMQAITNNGTGSITINRNNGANAAAAITNGANAGEVKILGGAKVSGAIVNNSTSKLTIVGSALLTVQSKGEVEVGTSSVAGSITGLLTMVANGGNVHFINGVPAAGITNNGAGNITIDKLSAAVTGDIKCTVNDKSITITDGTKKTITGDIEVKRNGTITLTKLGTITGTVTGVQGAVEITGTGKSDRTTVGGNITATTGAITLTNVSAGASVTTTTGALTLSNSPVTTDVKATGTSGGAISLTGDQTSVGGDVVSPTTVTIDCLNKTFASVAFKTGFTLNNGIVQDLKYNGTANYTVTTAGVSAIKAVSTGANKLSFTSTWNGTSVGEAAANMATTGEIYTAAQLAGINNSVATSYKLMTTVNANGTNGKILSIPTLSKNFDGNNKAITDVTLNTGSNNVGFFKLVNATSTIKNIRLTVNAISAASRANVAGLIGNSTADVTILNAQVTTGNIIGSYNIGGMIGKADGNVTFGDDTEANACKTTIGGFEAQYTGDVVTNYGTVGMYVGTMSTASKTLDVKKYCKHGTDLVRTVAQKEALGFKKNITLQGNVVVYFYGGTPFVGYSNPAATVKSRLLYEDTDQSTIFNQFRSETAYQDAALDNYDM